MLDIEKLKFPSDFKFGTSSVAHQIEGRWDGDGKGTSMWDEFSHAHPKNILDRSTADEACDSYHNFEEDVFMLKSMHATSYSFTLSWSRILPEGTTKVVNQKGLNYYNDLINTLLENGIEPIVTLTDMNLPLPLLQKYAGGWMNKKLIYVFESYAKLCFAKFGDRVQQWITLLPPWNHAWKSYAVGTHPPNLSLGSKGAYLALTNLLNAHAAVYRLYEKRFKHKHCGRVGISIQCSSAKDSDSDLSYQLGRIAYPLVHGKYPRHLTETTEVDIQCFPLPITVENELESVLKGSFDFLALYFTPEMSVKLQECRLTLQCQSEPIADSITMQNVLSALKTDYGNPEILVFCAGPRLALPSQMMDIDRAQYFNDVAKNILEAINRDRCNIKGYFPAKLMDCWEWDSGFTVSYGLFHVDFASPCKKRSPRASVVFTLKHLFNEKRIQPDLF